MPSDLTFKTMNTIHRILLKASAGRIGWTAGKMPALELTTTGRKSGQPRSTMLTSPYEEGDSIVVVASAGGGDADPAWFLNLRDNPDVTVRTEGRTLAMTARITEGDEKSKLWSGIVGKHGRYADYQSKTSREIPVVILEPAE